MDKRLFEKRCRYSIRKLAIGAASVMIGATFFPMHSAYALEDEATQSDVSLDKEVADSSLAKEASRDSLPDTFPTEAKSEEGASSELEAVKEPRQTPVRAHQIADDSNEADSLAEPILDQAYPDSEPKHLTTSSLVTEPVTPDVRAESVLKTAENQTEQENERQNRAIINRGQDLKRIQYEGNPTTASTMIYSIYDVPLADGKKQTYLSSGSGIFVAPNIMLTAAHLFLEKDKEGQAGQIRGGDTPRFYYNLGSNSVKKNGRPTSGNTIPFKKEDIYFWNKEEFGKAGQVNDLALVVAPIPIQLASPRKTATFAKLAPAGKHQAGQAISLVGYPNDNNSKELKQPIQAGELYKVEGTIRESKQVGQGDTTNITYHMTAISGLSGAGIVDDQGRVIGVHQYGTIDEQAISEAERFGGGLVLSEQHLKWIQSIINQHAIKGWYQGDDGKRYYFTPEGELLRSTSAVIGQNKYEFDETGLARLVEGVEQGSVLIQHVDQEGNLIKANDTFVPEGEIGRAFDYDYKAEIGKTDFYQKNKNKYRIVSIDGVAIDKQLADDWSYNVVSKVPAGNRVIKVVYQVNKGSYLVRYKLKGSDKELAEQTIDDNDQNQYDVSFVRTFVAKEIAGYKPVQTSIQSAIQQSGINEVVFEYEPIAVAEPANTGMSNQPTQPALQIAKNQLIYSKPAATSYDGWEKQALPVGNGEMGAKVFGLIGAEKIQYNEKTLWSGGPSSDSTDYNGGNYKDRYKVMAEIRRLLEAGKVSEAKKLAEQNLIGPYNAQYGRYLAFGDIKLDFTNQSKALDSVTDYHRGLDISTAISTTSYSQDGTSFSRETFSSYPDDVTVTHLTQKGDKKLDFTLTMDMTRDMLANGRYSQQQSDFKEGKLTVTEDGILLKGRVKDNGLEFASYLGLKTDGQVSLEEQKIKVTGASYADLLLSAKTNFAQNPKTNYRKELDVEKTVKDIVTKAKAKDYQTLKTDHIKDYQALFHRVKLDLGSKTTETSTKDLLANYRPEKGQALEELFYQYGRYLLITSSRDRQDALPANLQGVWNAVDNPPWNADYHLNVNLQMNYWPAYSGNLAETAKPLINYIDDMRYYGRIAAKEYAGITSEDGQENGWLVHTQATPFGWTTPGWNYYWGWSPAANAWIMQNVYDYYKFTQDEDYLKTKIYPMLKETAKFWNSFLHYDQASDRWVSSPSYSPEHGTITIGNTFDQSLVWQLFHDYMEAANHLQLDQDLVKEVAAKFEKLKPLHINQAGRIKEWYEEDSPVFTGEGVEKGHRHASHLVGLFPGTLFSKDNPAYLEAARASLNDRGDGGTGWSKANKINLWARLLDGNRAHKLLAEQLKSSTLENLWDTHAPFQIDGNFGATSGMTEMLLQSHTGYVSPLPALPDAWKDGQVSGLMARGNFETSMKWADKNLQTLTFLSKSGGDLIVDYPSIEQAQVKVNGQIVTPSLIKGNRIRIQTQKGDKIEFDHFAGRVTMLTAERKDGATAAVSFNAVEGASHYLIERTEKQEGQEPLIRRWFSKANQFVDRSLQADSSYTYRVQALFGEQATAISDPVSLAPYRQVFDDRDSRIHYGAAFGNWADGSLYEGTEKFADISNGSQSEADATASLSFEGTGIEVYGLRTPYLGLAKVTIDGKPVADLDFYDPTVQKSVLIGRYDGLAAGLHTMTITVKKAHQGRPNERAKISLDYFRVIAGKTSTSYLDSPSLGQLTTATKELTLTLPTGDWERVVIQLPHASEKRIITKAVDGSLLLDGSTAITAPNGQIRLPLESQYKLVAGDSIHAYSVRGELNSVTVVALVSAEKDSTDDPTDKPSQPADEQETNSAVAEKPAPSQEAALPAFAGGVAGDSLVAPSPRDFVGGVSGESIIAPSQPAFTGGVAGESQVEQALAIFSESPKDNSEENPSQAGGQTSSQGQKNPATQLRVLTDPATGVTVVGYQDSLDGVDQLRVKRVTSQYLLGQTYDAYDIKLVNKEGQLVQPKGSLVVELPIAAGKAVDTLYSLTDSGALQPVRFEIKGDFVDFTTDHFSIYALVYKEAAPSLSATSSRDMMRKEEQENTDSPSLQQKPSLPQTGDKGSSSLLFLASLSLALSLTFLGKRESDN